MWVISSSNFNVYSVFNLSGGRNNSLGESGNTASSSFTPNVAQEIEKLLNQKEIPQALQYLEESYRLTTGGANPQVIEALAPAFNKAINALVINHNMSVALDLMEYAKRAGIKVDFNYLMNASECGDQETSSASHFNGRQPENKRELKNVSVSYQDSSQPSAALNYFQFDVQNSNIIFNNARLPFHPQVKNIDRFLNSGEIGNALNSYSLATNAIKNQTREKLTTAYNNAIATLLIKKQAERALDLFAYAKRAGIEVDHETFKKLSFSLNKLALSFTRSTEKQKKLALSLNKDHRQKKALKLFSRMRNSDIEIFSITKRAYALFFINEKNWPNDYKNLSVEGKKNIKRKKYELAYALIKESMTGEVSEDAEALEPRALDSLLKPFGYFKKHDEMVEFLDYSKRIKPGAIRSFPNGQYEISVFSKYILKTQIKEGEERGTQILPCTPSLILQTLIYKCLTHGDYQKNFKKLTVIGNNLWKKDLILIFLRDYCKNFEVTQSGTDLVITPKLRKNSSASSVSFERLRFKA